MTLTSPGSRPRAADHPGDHAVDLGGEAVEHPALQRLDGVLRDHRPRAEQLDLAQLGARRPSASREISMPGAMAPPTYSPRGATTSKVVAVPKSTTIDGPVVEARGREGVDDPVRADLARVVHEHRHAGLHAGLDDDVRDRRVVVRHHLAPLVQHRGHRAAHRDAAQRRSSRDVGAGRAAPAAARPTRRRCAARRSFTRQWWLTSPRRREPDGGVAVADVGAQQRWRSRGAGPASSGGVVDQPGACRPCAATSSRPSPVLRGRTEVGVGHLEVVGLDAGGRRGPRARPRGPPSGPDAAGRHAARGAPRTGRGPASARPADEVAVAAGQREPVRLAHRLAARRPRCPGTGRRPSAGSA